VGHLFKDWHCGRVLFWDFGECRMGDNWEFFGEVLGHFLVFHLFDFCIGHVHA